MQLAVMMFGLEWSARHDVEVLFLSL